MCLLIYLKSFLCILIVKKRWRTWSQRHSGRQLDAGEEEKLNRDRVLFNRIFLLFLFSTKEPLTFSDFPWRFLIVTCHCQMFSLSNPPDRIWRKQGMIYSTLLHLNRKENAFFFFWLDMTFPGIFFLFLMTSSALLLSLVRSLQKEKGKIEIQKRKRKKKV